MLFHRQRRWTWTGDFKCREVKTGFCRKRWTQTGSSGTLIGWKSGQTTFIPLWDRMEGAWLWTQLCSSNSHWCACLISRNQSITRPYLFCEKQVFPFPKRSLGFKTVTSNLSDLAECVILCTSWLPSPGKVYCQAGNIWVTLVELRGPILYAQAGHQLSIYCIKELFGRNSPHLASVNSAYKI